MNDEIQAWSEALEEINKHAANKHRHLELVFEHNGSNILPKLGQKKLPPMRGNPVYGFSEFCNGLAEEIKRWELDYHKSRMLGSYQSHLTAIRSLPDENVDEETKKRGYKRHTHALLAEFDAVRSLVPDIAYALAEKGLYEELEQLIDQIGKSLNRGAPIVVTRTSLLNRFYKQESLPVLVFNPRMVYSTREEKDQRFVQELHAAAECKIPVFYTCGKQGI